MVTYDTRGYRSIKRYYNDLRKAIRKEAKQMMDWKTLNPDMKARLARESEGVIGSIDMLERAALLEYQPTSAAPKE